MKSSIRLIWFILFLLSLALPVFKRESSDFALVEKGVSSVIEQIGEKTWGVFSDALTVVKEKLFEEEVIAPPNWVDRWKERIYSGFGYGFSPIGATDKAIHDRKFNFNHVPSWLGLVQCVFTLVMMVLILFPRLHRYIGVIALSVILVTIYQFGLLVDDSEFVAIPWGVFLFVMPSVGMVVAGRT